MAYSKQPWLGYAFLAYLLFCATLSIGLLHWRDTQPPRFSDGLLPLAPELPRRATPDFQNINNVRAKKAQFFEFIAIGARQQNHYMKQLRQWLQQQQQRQQSGLAIEQAAIDALAKRYRVSATDAAGTLEQLLLHIDEIPLSLVLAQAANESAWGTSRFARKANNFFGQWCFSRGCGLVPKQRPDGATYEVKYFATVDESIAAYYLNLNSHPGYQELRRIRRQLRDQQKPIQGTLLAAGLIHYSSRGSAYVEELQAMIRFNDLQKYDVSEPAQALN